MKRSLPLAAAAILGLTTGCMPAHVRPAELMVERSLTAASGEDVGRAVGVGGRLVVGPIALSLSEARAISHPHGTPCGGFVMDPEPCTQQPLVQRDEIRRVSVGYHAAWPRERSRFFLSPYLGVARLEQERRGLMSGAIIDGTSGGVVLGLAGGVQYNLLGGLWLGVLADAALILPSEPGCVDCHVPYVEGIQTGGISVTASWRLR
jgi:hypothetical protein